MENSIYRMRWHPETHQLCVDLGRPFPGEHEWIVIAAHPTDNELIGPFISLIASRHQPSKTDVRHLDLFKSRNEIEFAWWVFKCGSDKSRRTELPNNIFN